MNKGPNTPMINPFKNSIYLNHFTAFTYLGCFFLWAAFNPTPLKTPHAHAPKQKYSACSALLPFRQAILFVRLFPQMDLHQDASQEAVYWSQDQICETLGRMWKSSQGRSRLWAIHWQCSPHVRYSPVTKGESCCYFLLVTTNRLGNTMQLLRKEIWCSIMNVNVLMPAT